MIFTYKSIQDFTDTIGLFCDDISTDILGNVIAHKQGMGKRIMLIAHHDVICLMVTHVDDKGFLYVKPSGGIDAAILPARKIIIHHKDKRLTGVIGKKPIHLMRDEGNNCKVEYEDLWVDIGAKSRAEALEMVAIGDYAYFCSDYEVLSNGLISGSYLDDMAGLCVLLELAKQLRDTKLPWDVYFVASNYEEIGLRGAKVAAHAIYPDACICIDVTNATDYPTINVVRYGDIKVGEGCVLAKGPNIFPELFESLQNIAIKNNIAYQIEVTPYPTGTDANVIQLTADGIRTAVVSIPCRYMHTPHEVCSLRDIDSAVKIVGGILRAL